MARSRLTFETTPAIEDALKELCVATGRLAVGDVVRDALELYDLIISRRAKGETLRLGDAEVVLPQVEMAARIGMVIP